MATKVVNGQVVECDEADLAEIEAKEAEHLARLEVLAQQAARSATRTALRAQWEGLPAWIRGPYRSFFEAANALLDEGDDEAAVAMIQSAEPCNLITNDPNTYPELGGATRAQYFEAVRAGFAAAIAAL